MPLGNFGYFFYSFSFWEERCARILMNRLSLCMIRWYSSTNSQLPYEKVSHHTHLLDFFANFLIVFQLSLFQNCTRLLHFDINEYLAKKGSKNLQKTLWPRFNSKVTTVQGQWFLVDINIMNSMVFHKLVYLEW